MFPSVALLILWLTAYSFGTPLRTSNPPHVYRAPHKFIARRSFPNFDKQTALAAQSRTIQKFRDATARLAGHNTSPGYAIPLLLQEAYDRASDQAVNVRFQKSLSPSTVRTATSGHLDSTNRTIICPLEDETDGINDYEYYGLLFFGSQAQPLSIDFDTGSADLWVPAGCGNCQGLTQFQTNTSSSFRNLTRPFAIKYGRGEAIGTVVQDTISVGSVHVHNQTFGAVTSISPNFANAPSDGIVGLAFGTISNTHSPTFFENMIEQIDAPLFSVFMSRGKVHGSEICFGCIDISKAADEHVTWVPVASKTYWSVDLTNVSVNDSTVPTHEIMALVDTGTSFLYVPTAIAAAIYARIPGSEPAPGYGKGFYKYPCNAVFTITFNLGGHPLEMGLHDMNLGRYENDVASNTCIGAIVGATLGFAILGDSFCKNYVTIFDYSHGARVGFLRSVDY